MHEVLVKRLGGLRLPRKSVVRFTDRPNMTLGVYRGRKTTIQQQQPPKLSVLQYQGGQRSSQLCNNHDKFSKTSVARTALAP